MSTNAEVTTMSVKTDSLNRQMRNMFFLFLGAALLTVTATVSGGSTLFPGAIMFACAAAIVVLNFRREGAEQEQ